MSPDLDVRMDPLSFCSFRLTLRSDTDNDVGQATGFVVAHDANRFLITNGHVVTGQHPQTGHSIGEAPDHLAVDLHRQAVMGRWRRVRVPLRDQEHRPLWREHPSGLTLVPFANTQVGVLLLPDVERGFADTELPTDVCGRRPALDLAQGVGDLLFSEFGFLHRSSSSHSRTATRRDSLLQTAHVFRGDVRSLIIHEITAHRIEQWKRERFAGKWRAHGQKSNSNSLKPGTVNRELDTLKSILSKAVEWRKLIVSPAAGVKRLKTENRRTRILTADEQVNGSSRRRRARCGP
jgi:hypothetical protein